MTAAKNAGWLGVAVLILATAGPGATRRAGGYSHNAVVWGAQRSPLSIELHAAGVDDLAVEDLEGVVRSTIAEWNSVPCAWLALEFGGRTGDHVAVDERQIIEWIEDEEAWVYGAMSAGATISVVYDDPETPEREEPRVDIAFNGVDYEWRIGGSDAWDGTVLDPEAVLTHEMGHLLGLAHSRHDNAATMGPAYLPDLSQRSLGLDDKVGLCEKYWVERSECGDDLPCPGDERCVEYESEAHGGRVLLCEEQHGTFGDRCSIDDLRCEGICMFLRMDLSLGYCTARCAQPADCPEGFSCEEVPVGDGVQQFCRSAAIESGEDAGIGDGGPSDGGAGDGGWLDAATPDGGALDGAVQDGGHVDGGAPDGGTTASDAAAGDAGGRDAAPAQDAYPPDSSSEPTVDVGAEATADARPDGGPGGGREPSEDEAGCGSCAADPGGTRSAWGLRALLRAGLLRPR